MELWIGLAVGGLILLAVLWQQAPVVWGRRRAIRITRAMQFTGTLSHTITVPADEDGRPGQRFTAPSLSSYAPYVDDNGDRSDCSIALSERLSALRVVCFGRVELGDHVQRTIDAMVDQGVSVVSEPMSTELLGESAVTYQLRFPGGNVLTEWKLDHDGWRYAIGVVRNRRDDDGVLELARAALDTWEWLPPPRALGA